MKPIKVAIIGLGNCASSLVQGVSLYQQTGELQGVIQETIAGYLPGDIEFVLGIDVDQRKVGKDIAQAIFAAPNNTEVFNTDVKDTGAVTMRGALLDGVAEHMTEAGEAGFMPSEEQDPAQDAVVTALKQSGADVVVNFLPVGSQQATEFYMECALQAGVGVVNCIPVFIASDTNWEARFREHGLPIVGDDIKAQVGATIIHRRLSQLFASRGVNIERTYQLNTGGNTDFMNMLDQDRLGDKKQSKTQAVQAALKKRLADENISIGPAEYVPWQKDNKICFLRVEGAQWGGVPMHLEMRLSVEDSPNSAACVLDAIRYCKGAMDAGEAGGLIAPSAFYCKHPPQQMDEQDAQRTLEKYSHEQGHASKT